MNSLKNACNQKSNREPVMNLSEGQIGHVINELVERKLAGLEYGDCANCFFSFFKFIHLNFSDSHEARKGQPQSYLYFFNGNELT